MPIYEYRCKVCGKVSEILTHSYNNRAPECSCGSRDLEKLLSVPSLLKEQSGVGGTTCCGRAERCETPPCGTERGCQRR
jgi:putative FmdB family regulatory protein